ncbi:MAG: hypothetical protein Q9195_000307 [Heterodermia aff. obscurata]
MAQPPLPYWPGNWEIKSGRKETRVLENVVSPIPGASEKITSLRTRHGQLTSSVARFEARVSKQTGQLAQINKGKDSHGDYDEDDDNDGSDDHARQRSIFEQPQITAEDFLREEEEIRELEKKKRALENRVSEMERDLGGLLR